MRGLALKCIYNISKFTVFTTLVNFYHVEALDFQRTLFNNIKVFGQCNSIPVKKLDDYRAAPQNLNVCFRIQTDVSPSYFGITSILWNCSR